jgi:hypothetical protein
VARELTAREVPLLVVLTALRTGPAMRRRSVRGRILDQFVRSGFVVLHDAPRQVVLGAVGRFWQLSGGVRRIDASEFPGFAEPGYAKAVFELRAEARGEGTWLVTETRVLATDEHARRRFRRYWRFVHPGSAAIRLAWLRAIRRRAERSQPASSPTASARSS